jgi:hypothetical protein
MGRPSKLTDDQWADAKRRILAGESPADVARHYGVSRATMSTRVSNRVLEIKTVAEQVVQAERSLAALPVSEQLLTVSLASRLRAISDNLASAAHHGAATAHRLNALANAEVGRVDDAEPMASLENLRNVGVLTKLANDSASIALNLLAANKETVAKINAPPPEDNAAPLRPQLSRDEWLKTHGLA